MGRKAIPMMLMLLVSMTADAATITVGQEDGSDYFSIQEAVDAADPGDTIEVYHGTYRENVDVTKTLILRGIDSGDCMPIVDGQGGDAITLSADNITLEGFIVTNSSYGIWLRSNHNAVRSNEAVNNTVGIYIYHHGDCDENELSFNRICHNEEEGIYLSRSRNNNITGNLLSDNEHGIRILYDSDNNTISKNDLAANRAGMWLYGSDNNTVADNDLFGNLEYGAKLVASDYNEINENEFRENQNFGLWLDESRHNILKENLIRGSSCNFGMDTCERDYFENDVDSTNLVDGRPICYLVGVSDRVIDSSQKAGCVFCIDCTNVTVKNQVLKNNAYGIYLYNTSHSKFEDNQITDNNISGINMESSPHNYVMDNRVSRNKAGILLTTSSHCVLERNNLSDGENGVILLMSNRCALSKNNFSHNGLGISLFLSDNCDLTGNYICDNMFGIIPSYSSKINMKSNVLSRNRGNFQIMYVTGTSSIGAYPPNPEMDQAKVILLSIREFDHDIDASNLVDGKPICYLKGVNDKVIDSNVGVVYCINCQNVTVTKLSLANNIYGVCFYNTSNSLVVNNEFDPHSGIGLVSGENNILKDNYLKDGSGIEVAGSDNDSIDSNIFFNNTVGIHLIGSHNCFIKDNQMQNNTQGLLVGGLCKNNVLRDNQMYSNRFNFGVESGLINDIDASNLVDGKPIVYLTGVSNLTVDSSSDAGTVCCINCHNLTIKDLDISKNMNGIRFFNTTSSKIENNRLHENSIGIHLEASHYNLVTGNVVRNNSDYGIYLEDSTKNSIYGNCIYTSVGLWGSGGGVRDWGFGDWRNRWYNDTIGNYYSDFDDAEEGCLDQNEDGICDQYRRISSDDLRDYRPLTNCILCEE